MVRANMDTLKQRQAAHHRDGYLLRHRRRPTNRSAPRQHLGAATPTRGKRDRQTNTGLQLAHLRFTTHNIRGRIHLDTNDDLVSERDGDGFGPFNSEIGRGGRVLEVAETSVADNKD